MAVGPVSRSATPRDDKGEPVRLAFFLYSQQADASIGPTAQSAGRRIGQPLRSM